MDPKLTKNNQPYGPIRYKELVLSDYDASILISDKDMSVYYDEALKTGASYKLLANWVIGDVQAILNK